MSNIKVGEIYNLSDMEGDNSFFAEGMIYRCETDDPDTAAVYKLGVEYPANGDGIVDEYDKGSNTSHCTSGDVNFTLIKMPKQTKPIYTAAMCEANELPLAGMEVMIQDESYSEEYFKGVISFTGRSNIVWVHGGSEYSQSITHLKFKPLNPPIDLIDGEPYEFNYSNGNSGMQGAVMRYRKSGDYFFFDNIIYKRKYCTNIQLLGVKS